MPVMSGVRLPGDSTVQHVKVEVPEPGPGQVLLRMKASSICGSDIRAIYRQHLGTGPEAYQGVIAGHEPCGQVVAVGPACRRLADGRPGRRLPHRRLRGLRGVPARLHDRLHLTASRGARMAARRWARRVPAGRGDDLHPAAGAAVLRRRRARVVRLRHRLRGFAAPASCPARTGC